MGKSNREQVKGLDPAPPVQTPARGARLSEAQLERQCSDLLALDGWRSLKTDPVSDRSRGKGFGELGMADRLYIRYREPVQPVQPLLIAAAVQLMWIEWKRIRPDRCAAERALRHQHIWQRCERTLGALVLCAGEDFPATFEGFCAWYSKSGLLRRAGLCKTG